MDEERKLVSPSNGLEVESKNKDEEKIKVEQQPTPTVTDNANGEVNVAIVEEFQYLLEKSQQLFSGLRDLPVIGSKGWTSYFLKTFEIYNRLWRYQQEHRVVLENKEHYGLKRWEVGEIASKIGQLYYHYYLRTSDTKYLLEASRFYEAILERNYFKQVLDIKNSAQFIKKLRYYARFVVVCLLEYDLNKALKLFQSLKGFVETYTKTFKPVDAMEWQLVLEEIYAFLQSERKLVPQLSGTGKPVQIQFRKSDEPLDLDLKPVSKEKETTLRLQEVIVVANTPSQLKFSEMTVDMFRMALTLEVETLVQPNELEPRQTTTTSTEPAVQPKPNKNKILAPHKAMLFQPTVAQLLIYLANAFKELQEGSGAMLLYLSSEQNVNNLNGVVSGYQNGVAIAPLPPTESKSELEAPPHLKSSLFYADLLPFTRKPIFIILDTLNPTPFAKLPNLFYQPVIVLMAALESPFKELQFQFQGNLLTLTLTQPTIAFCHLADLVELEQQLWVQVVSTFDKLEGLILQQLLTNLPNEDNLVYRFLSDKFLATFLTRFCLANMLLASHRLVKDKKHLPTSNPPIPKLIYKSSEILNLLKNLYQITDTQSIFTNLNQDLKLGLLH